MVWDCVVTKALFFSYLTFFFLFVCLFVFYYYLFYLFINGLDAGLKGLLSLWMTLNWEEMLTHSGWKALQRYLHKLEGWLITSCMRISAGQLGVSSLPIEYLSAGKQCVALVWLFSPFFFFFLFLHIGLKVQ